MTLTSWVKKVREGYKTIINKSMIKVQQCSITVPNIGSVHYGKEKLSSINKNSNPNLDLRQMDSCLRIKAISLN